MAVSAHRYCLGRQTYIVSYCVEWLISIWDILPEKAKMIISRDTETAFKDHAAGLGWAPLGGDIDVKEWEKLRALWSKKDEPRSAPNEN
jgi:hypothetical protein